MRVWPRSRWTGIPRHVDSETMPLSHSINPLDDFPAGRAAHSDFDPVAEIRRLRQELSGLLEEMASGVGARANRSASAAVAATTTEESDWREGDISRYASRAALVPVVSLRAQVAELAEFSPRLDLPPLAELRSRIRSQTRFGERPERQEKSETNVSTPTRRAEGTARLRVGVASFDHLPLDIEPRAAWHTLMPSAASRNASIHVVRSDAAHKPSVATTITAATAATTCEEASWLSLATVVVTLAGIAALVVGTVLALRGYQMSASSLEMLGKQVALVGAVVLAIRLVGNAITPESSH